MSVQFSTKYKQLFFISLLLLILSLSSTITLWFKQRQAVREKTDQKTEQPYGRFSQRLGFDQQQRYRYNSLLKEYQQQTISFREDLIAVQEEMLKTLNQENVDTMALDSLSYAAAQLQHLIRTETFRHLLEVKQISSPEQKEALSWLYRELINENKLKYNMRQNRDSNHKGRFRGGRN